MQGSMAIRNEPKAMLIYSPTEFLYVVQADDTVESVASDSTLFSAYFQKMFIYPAKDKVTGILTPNANPIYVGKSGPGILGTLTSLTAKGSVAHAEKVAHGIQQGWPVSIVGPPPGKYNGVFRAINVTPNTFDFQLKQDPGGPAAGPVAYARDAYVPDKLEATDTLPIKYELPLGYKQRVSDVVVNGKAGDGVFIQFW